MSIEDGASLWARALQAFEESAHAVEDAPGPDGLWWPGTCHPYYAEHRDSIAEWLSRSRDYQVYIPKRVHFKLSDFTDPDPIAPRPEPDVLQRQKAQGPAPYVGDPFVYVWWVGVDPLGRGVASEARIEDVPPGP